MVQTSDHSEQAPSFDEGRVARERDRAAEARDQDAQTRDDHSDERDEAADAREQGPHPGLKGAAADRAAAKLDRQHSSTDRRQAEHDRRAAASDRALSARRRQALLIDGLTGAHRREAGLMELERQVVQAHRTGHPFTLAFIDIDSLKVTNDRYGHAAGDVLLVRVVDALRGVLRSYDLVVRYGGDEFLCGMTDLSAKEASRRFEEVNERLAVANSDSVSVGLAELTGESLESLIARADAAMYERREKRAL